MGFGTSGSLLVVFTGLFIAMGTMYTAAGNVSEELNEAGETQNERFLAAQESDVNITRAAWNSTEANFTVAIENAGERTLSVEHTDVVVDGTYVPVEAFERAEVDGVSTDTWRPGEVLVLEDGDTVADFPEAPGRVKVVAGTAVGDVSEVTVVP